MSPSASEIQEQQTVVEEAEAVPKTKKEVRPYRSAARAYMRFEDEKGVPTVRVSEDTLNVVEDLAKEALKSLARTAGEVAKNNGDSRVSRWHVETAVKLVFGPELAEAADKHAALAYEILADQKKAARDKEGGAKDGEAKEDDGKCKESLQKRSGLGMPLGRIHKDAKAEAGCKYLGKDAEIAFSAALDSVVRLVVDTAMTLRPKGRLSVPPECVRAVLKINKEFRALLGEEAIVDVNASKPKKRARKAAEEESKEDEEEAPPKKRGRKAKEDETAEPPKKRGRKPKAAPVAEEAVEEVVDVPSE